MSRSPSANDKAQSLHRDEMEHIQPAMSIPISPELFEQLYLQPQNNVKGDLRKTFGNPTPIGESCALKELSCTLMEYSFGWISAVCYSGIDVFAGMAGCRRFWRCCECVRQSTLPIEAND
jgi:hypothetical protein